MLILGIDTSLPVFSIAIVNDGGIVAAYAAEGRSSRNEKLLPAVEWMLNEGGIGRSELGLLAVTRGPGSFTGVRVGLATVQGLAFALGLPVCAISTHESVLGAEREEALVFSDAGRGEWYVSGFRGGEEELAPSLAGAERLDSLRRSYAETIDLDALARRENLALLTARRAGALAARDALASRADATPIYVRLAEAEQRLRDGHG
ncbi:MAG TPA: tRNA (adenosine(37)-N6)-threonylcarbamoyltransferase complex dimerization subunit type 1 TsaB [Thermoanaerobaculia bacterium]|nr:tRNA (adenosine(37)-N6)-threonylcarbamoyltransferase complex dimerization subunit type 1 TsaB [Thermoanaerobaculia bacterium]